MLQVHKFFLSVQSQHFLLGLSIGSLVPLFLLPVVMALRFLSLLSSNSDTSKCTS